MSTSHQYQHQDSGLPTPQSRTVKGVSCTSWWWPFKMVKENFPIRQLVYPYVLFNRYHFSRFTHSTIVPLKSLLKSKKLIQKYFRSISNSNFRDTKVMLLYCTNPNENLFKNKNQKHPQEWRGVHTFTCSKIHRVHSINKYIVS